MSSQVPANGLSDCPTAEELRQFVLGHPSARAGELERHLLECCRCLDRARSLPEDDPLVDAVRRSPSVPQEKQDQALVGELLRRLAGAGLAGTPSDDPDAQDTIETRHRSGGLTPAPEEAVTPAPPLAAGTPTHTFLAPPRQAGEIGRLGGYRILEELGRGGMGVVFRAHDPRLQRQVALKVIRPELSADPRIQERFLREARAAAAVVHEHVVTVYQADQSGGVLFLTMPLLQGESLHARLERERRLAVADVLRIGREVAEGLAAAHGQGLIHRDVKPANIWLEGERGKVKVLDFGLARPARDAGMTHPGIVVGTPEYMAPEQATGAALDARADLFGLGCLLYALSTGEPPFTGLAALVVEQPPPLRERNPEVPAALSDLVMNLLAKDREDRPASAREVAAALAGIDSGATGCRQRGPARAGPDRGGGAGGPGRVATGAGTGGVPVRDGRGGAGGGRG